MANLKDRLKIIQNQKKNEVKKETPPVASERQIENSTEYATLKKLGWISCGYKVLKREAVKEPPFNSKNALPKAIPIIIRDLSGFETPKYGDFVFFDLETTGLSGGAGTMAFLAAFGRIVKYGSNDKLRVTQYLLLDYPGENDFIDAVLKEFTKTCVIVTYNGKTFDSQILKTRCLMNRIPPPEYKHADLLHPARRLWKNIIQNCSQSSIETKILGIDRSGDIPGSMAPDIWFEFLKTGKTDNLMGICDHNIADITGLASIMSVMIKIAEDPFNAKYDYDVGRLALYWRIYSRYYGPDDLRETGDKLLQYTANENIKCLPNIKAAVLRALAIDCERKEKNYPLAMEYANKGLALKDIGENWRDEFVRRKERLERKIQNACNFNRSNP